MIRVTRGPGGPFTGRWVPLAETELLPPTKPTKIVCVGRNYREHAHEMGEEVPSEPGLFLKAPNALATPNARIPYPSFTHCLHYEGELAVVIGRRMRRVSEERALSHVLGYTCALDLTARDRQKTDLQWIRAKSADLFCSLGPWVETELEPLDLLRTRVNREIRQEGRTSAMVFSRSPDPLLRLELHDPGSWGCGPHRHPPKGWENLRWATRWRWKSRGSECSPCESSLKL